MTVQYIMIGYHWCVHPSRKYNEETFRIKIMHLSHIGCNCISTSSHPKVSKKWASVPMIQMLKDWPLYRVVDIHLDILHEYGVSLPYKQTWLGKEVARTILHRSEVSSYDFTLKSLILFYNSPTCIPILGWNIHCFRSEKKMFSEITIHCGQSTANRWSQGHQCPRDSITGWNKKRKRTGPCCLLCEMIQGWGKEKGELETETSHLLGFG